MENEMTLQGQYEHDHGLRRESSHGFPTRAAAALVILVALSLIEATPGTALGPAAIKQPRYEQSAPSACGAEAVARAQREVGKSQPTTATAHS